MTSIRAALLSYVLLVLETTVDEGASAASAEISQGLSTQRRQSPPSIVQARDYIHFRSIQYNTVNWKLGKCSEISLVSREGWGARKSKDVDYLITNGGVKLVFYHHTEGPKCNSRDTCGKIIQGWQRYHQDTKGWADIAYNFMIGGDGRVYEGRGFDGIGAHTLSYNHKSVSFGFVGNFTFDVPTSEMLEAADLLIACGIESGKIGPNYRLYGQRDANLRDCPGDAFYALIKNNTRFGGRLEPYISTPRQR